MSGEEIVKGLGILRERADALLDESIHLGAELRILEQRIGQLVETNREVRYYASAPGAPPYSPVAVPRTELGNLVGLLRAHWERTKPRPRRRAKKRRRAR